MSYLRDQLASLQQELADLKASQVRYVNAPVVENDPTSATFSIRVNGAQGGTEILRGLDSSKHHLPTVGSTARIALVGGQPVFQPGEIASGAIGDDELANPVKEQIATAYDTANGKNKVTFASGPPTSATPGERDGDLWFQRDGSGLGVIVGTWEWVLNAWSPRTFHDSVLASLTVGKLVSGTGTFDMLMAGSIYSATSGSRYRIDATGIKLWSESNPTPTIDLNAVTGNATFRGTVEGALFRTSASGQRFEITGGGTAGGRTLTFYPAGAGQAATVYSRDDAAGNAGVSMESGGTNRGFVNFTSTFADIGFLKGSGAASFIRVADDGVYGMTLAVAAGKGILLNSPLGIDFYSGAGRFANLNPASGLEGIGKFALTYSTLSNFTFGINSGESNADIYALRFISTNPGATGGFVYFSDRRLKKNVRNAAFDALSEVLNTPVREFEWESTGEKSFGFVAQEVPADVQVRLSPDSPIDGVSNPVGVASEQMMAKLVKAMQQLNQKVDNLIPKGHLK